ncbi:MAG: hypothetical protein CMO64_08300 [Verrucomicrobiales bacterium]|nr:hypothetical protein [Verrucomicrobiales bacterium]|tara:strand:- start:301 stop:1029 length:729 start_codon:yes stop_codon:yes gene_type:complete
MAGGGGAWKVAYADLVTAMMALFMTLWILAQDETVKGDVQAYFQTRFDAITMETPGVIPNEFLQLVQSRKDNFDASSPIPLEHVRIINEDLKKVYIDNPNDIDLNTMTLEMSEEGLLITILDNPDRPVFEDGKDDQLTEHGRNVFTTVAQLIARYKDTQVEIEGHTAKGFVSTNDLDKWEVSTARAHKAMEYLVNKGVHESQVTKVAGYGDTRTLKNRPKTASQNNRVSIRVRAKQELREES